MSDNAIIRRHAGAPAQSRHERDDGSTLILVLLLVVVAGLVVLPLMTYAASVLRLNTAVSERSKDVEASKAGLRVALADPAQVFTSCDDGGTLDALDINGTPVSTTCAELAEVGPLDALGYQVPFGAVATQVGAEVPSIAVGGSMQSDPVPSYPTTADWWATMIPTSPNEPWDAVSDTIWLPELPRWPSTARTDTPFNMPVGFNAGGELTGVPCKVFFPGQYDQPIDLDADIYYYFASGVYYFDQPITVSGNADVVVGYGLEDFEDRPSTESSPCADDLQVATSVVNGPSTFAIDGGGATWVFGEDARLIVDDSTGSPSIRFNQRYSEEDRGGRVSIMTVNGVANGSVVDPHDVPMVSLIPESQWLETVDPDTDDSTAYAIDGTNGAPYVPSSPTFTDAARPPVAPTVTIDGRRYRDGFGNRGGLLITWDELTGNDAGGSLITDYHVTVSDGVGDVCDQPGDIVFTDGGGTLPNTLSCYIADLDQDEEYDVTVTAENAVGLGPSTTVDEETEDSGPRDDAPDPVTNVALEETDVDDVARVTWTPGASDDAPITGYQATIARIENAPITDVAPRLFGGSYLAPYLGSGVGSYLELVGNSPVGTHIAAVDPNGGPVTLTFDPDDIPTDWSIDQPTPGGLDIIVTPPATGSPSFLDPAFLIDYTVADPAGNVAHGTLVLDWRTVHVFGRPDAKSFDALPVAGIDYVIELPASDPRGRPLTATIDTSAFGPEWTFDLTGTTLTVNTTETTDAAGTDLRLNYTVDNGTRTDQARIDFEIPTLATVDVDTCSFAASPWHDQLPTSCEIAGIPDLTDPSEIGYVARVEAINAVGRSIATESAAPYPMAFDADPTASPAPAAPERVVDPWMPEPIIDIRAGGGHSAHVRIGGYVSIPMGRIQIDNPDGDGNDTIEIVGGIAAGTYEMVDPDDTDTIIGFLNDIVLQRKVRITSTAGNTTSTAIVQLNEDGAAYAINSWVVD